MYIRELLFPIVLINKNNILYIRIFKIVFVARCVELEARITFKSNQPISFCLTIEFSDDHQLAACFLTVYATADNSLLTTYMYSVKFNFDKTYTRYLEKLVSCPSVLSDSTTDEDDYEEIPYTRRQVCFYFFTFRFITCNIYFREVMINII